MLSDVAADQIVALRKERGLTHRQLAERCAELGWSSLTPSAISNIETGRRDADGRRRREITVDELVVIARALDTYPLFLVAPLGQRDTVEALPDRSLDTLDAYAWLAGRRSWGHLPGWGPTGPIAPVIEAYEHHLDALSSYLRAREQQDQDAAREAWTALQAAQQHLVSRGWRVPPIPEQGGDDS